MRDFSFTETLFYQSWNTLFLVGFQMVLQHLCKLATQHLQNISFARFLGE